MENNNLTTSIIEYIEKQYGNTISESVIDKYKTEIQRIVKEEIVNVRTQLEESLNEDISIPVNIGDTVLMGKFKNKRVVIKSITKNEKGDYLINGKPAFKFRLIKET
jgi:ABC-type transporter MlaC component